METVLVHWTPLKKFPGRSNPTELQRGAKKLIIQTKNLTVSCKKLTDFIKKLIHQTEFRIPDPDSDSDLDPYPDRQL